LTEVYAAVDASRSIFGESVQEGRSSAASRHQQLAGDRLQERSGEAALAIPLVMRSLQIANTGVFDDAARESRSWRRSRTPSSARTSTSTASNRAAVAYSIAAFGVLTPMTIAPTGCRS
jgi:energy-coupling factor transporter transmembrane protein EcfT